MPYFNYYSCGNTCPVNKIIQVVLVGKHNGQNAAFNRRLLEKIMTPEEIAALYNKLNMWLKI